MEDTGNAILKYLSLYCRLCDCREYEKDLMNVSMEIFEATDVTGSRVLKTALDQKLRELEAMLSDFSYLSLDLVYDKMYDALVGR